MGGIPERDREAVRRALDELVAGQRPELMTWVHEYGEDGTQLVVQPDELWDHPRTEHVPRDDGTAYIVVPLWTRDESPSDLSAEGEVSASGQVQITDVHVL
jgi:hypothetical protein